MNRRIRFVAGKALAGVRRALGLFNGPTLIDQLYSSSERGLHARPSLAGARVLITGSTRGIGKAMADGFVASGARVVVHGRSQTDAGRTALALAADGGEEARPIGIGADLSQPGAGRDLVQRALDELGGLDIVINNAAVHDPRRKPIWSTTLEEMQYSLNVNLLSPFEVSAAAVQSMLARGIAGRILNISSGAADPVNVSRNGIASYGISKFALEGLSCYLAAETRGITVVTLRPGGVNTDMVAPLFAFDQRLRMLPAASMVPIVLHLASAPAADVHGKVFEQEQLQKQLAAAGPNSQTDRVRKPARRRSA
jgi:NAD(P)-dependent dehydrogenase (short-subunit alcohol dehydrogenase family)